MVDLIIFQKTKDISCSPFKCYLKPLLRCDSRRTEVFFWMHDLLKSNPLTLFCTNRQGKVERSSRVLITSLQVLIQFHQKLIADTIRRSQWQVRLALDVPNTTSVAPNFQNSKPPRATLWSLLNFDGRPAHPLSLGAWSTIFRCCLILHLCKF